ncbi:hypothetical protein LOAG_12953, partial [Loa loa]
MIAFFKVMLTTDITIIGGILTSHTDIAIIRVVLITDINDKSYLKIFKILKHIYEFCGRQPPVFKLQERIMDGRKFQSSNEMGYELDELSTDKKSNVAMAAASNKLLESRTKICGKLLKEKRSKSILD